MLAVGLPLLDEVFGPRRRDPPDPVQERPSWMRRQARRLLRQAAAARRAGQSAEMERLRGEAYRLLQERTQKLTDMERAATHPATHHTEAAWGAGEDEPNPEFPRALRRTLLDLGVQRDLADRLVDTGEEGEGQEGDRKRQKGGWKGEKG